jgi:hypothetical protein
MLVSEATPHRNWPSYLSAYHPNTHLSTTRSASEWKQERGRLDAIAASGDRGLKGSGKVEKDQHRKAKSGEYGSTDQIPSPLYTYVMSGRCRVRRLVSVPPARALQTLTGGRGPPIRLCGSNKPNKARRRSVPWVPRADRGSRVGLGTTTVTGSAPMMPTMPQHACNFGNRCRNASTAKGRNMARRANAEWTPVRWQNRTIAASVKVIF